MKPNELKRIEQRIEQQIENQIEYEQHRQQRHLFGCFPFAVQRINLVYM